MNRRKLTFMTASLVLMFTLLTSGLVGQGIPDDSVFKNLSIFTEVFSLIRSNYVDQVETEKLVDGAFTGITDAIDEYSFYVPPALMKQYREHVTRSAADRTGLVLSKRFGYAYLVAPVAGSPADLAGLQAGDFIESIDGRSTSPMSVWQINDAVSGEPGTTVKLVVLKNGTSERQTVTIVRDEYEPEIVSWDVRDGIGILRIESFHEGAADAVASALANASERKVGEIVVDVRGNASGSTEEAIRAADSFLAKGTISSLKGKKEAARRWAADREVAYDGTVLVLTNRSTAGAAEIFAAALQGNGRARTVGVPTYGMTGVQKLVELPSGGALYVTTARYTRPDLAPIPSEGLRPDVAVDYATIAINRAAAREDGLSEAETPDIILQKALRMLQDERRKNAA